MKHLLRHTKDEADSTEDYPVSRIFDFVDSYTNHWTIEDRVSILQMKVCEI